MANVDSTNLEAMGEAVAYQSAMRALTIDKLGLAHGRGRVLDFGAGRGDYAVAIQQGSRLEVLSLEPDVDLHQHYPTGTPVLASLMELAPASLDCAYSLNVFEHIENDVRALEQLARRCRPGVLVFVLVPAGPELWTAMDTLVGHKRRYTKASLRALVQDAGLTVVEEGWFDRTGYFATRAFQLVQRLRGGPQAACAGAISKVQVRCFDALFRVAEPLLNRLQLPFGKNCWVLAKAPTPRTT